MHSHFEPESLDTPPHLSPSPPAPVCQDTPVTPSFGCQLLLPPPTTDLSVVTAVEVVSLAIGAAAGVGITFGVGKVTRHEGKFDVWLSRCGEKDYLAWVRAVAARRGGVESRSVVNSGGNDAEGSAYLEVEDYLQCDVDSLCETFVTVYFAWHLQCFDTTRAFQWDLTVVIFIRRPPPLPPGFGRLVMWIHQAMYIDSLLSEHDMVSSNAVITLLEPSHSLGHEDATYPVIDNEFLKPPVTTPYIAAPWAVDRSLQAAAEHVLFEKVLETLDLGRMGSGEGGDGTVTGNAEAGDAMEAFAASLDADDYLCKSTLLSIRSDIRWVYEFKIDKSGRPLICITRLVVQEFFRVPFVTYGGTFVPISQAIIICFVTIGICGPFLVITPHGKTYSVLFFGQNLARRSDVRDVWWILKANFIDSVSFSIDDYSTPLFFGPRVNRPHLDVTNVPDLPRNPANIVYLEHLDTESSPAPVFTTPRSSHLQIAPTLSREGWIARQGGGEGDSGMGRSDAGGEGDDNPFVVWCNSGVLDECTARTDSAVMAASLDADDYLQRDIDSLYEAITNVPNLAVFQPPNLANILDLAPPTDDQLPSSSLQDLITPLPSQSRVVPSAPNPVRRIHSVFTSTHDYSTLSFLEQHPSAPTLSPNLSNPEGLDTQPSHLDTEELPSRSPSPFIVPVPVMPPLTSQFHIAPATPKAIQTRSLDPSITRRLMEKGQISEKIEADKVREAAAQRGGVLDWGVVDRRADRGVHERDYTARGTWIHQEIYSDSLPPEHEFTSSCNSVVMPLDPSHPLDRDGQSVVGVSGCGLRRGQDSTSFDFGVCVARVSWFSTTFSPPLPRFSPTSAISVRFSSSASPRSPGFPRFAGFPPARRLFQTALRLHALVHFRALVLHPCPHLRSPLSTLKTRRDTYTLLRPSTMPSIIT
jgi:hypothetical protein